MSHGGQLVSVVLPVHNQADHIAAVVQQYAHALHCEGVAAELVLVVNACTDESLVVCRTLGEQVPIVRVVDTPLGGWGRAVRLGLAAARGELLCYANSARTSASDLVALVRYALANPGAVVKPHRRSRESWSRRIGSFLFNAEVRLLFDLPTWDINATPKVFHRDLYRQLDLRADGDLIDLEFYLACRALDRTILEVPIYSWQRFGGGSTTTYRSAARLYVGAFRLWRRWRRP